MPYIYAVFEDSVITAMYSAVERIASGSAFVAQKMPFHVRILGSLHVYTSETIANTIANTTPLRGRFGKWELHANQLCCTVEIFDSSEILNHLQSQLPRGRPWRTHFVTLGSVEGIASAQRDEFLSAVESAFPIDAAMEFAMPRLQYHTHLSTTTSRATAKQPSSKNSSKLPSKPPRGRPNTLLAPPRAVPLGRSAIDKSKQLPPHSRVTQHLKWGKKPIHKLDVAMKKFILDD